jgi:ABC-2 type transport system permease protein
MNYDNKESLQSDFRKGKLAGIIKIEKNKTGTLSPYTLSLKSCSASNDKWPQLKYLLENNINEVSNKVYLDRLNYVSFHFNPQQDVETVRAYKTIDFILPGQLSFSLLSIYSIIFLCLSIFYTNLVKSFYFTKIFYKII